MSYFWYEEFDINDKKTVCIHFSRVQHTCVKCIIVKGKQIPWSKTVRHLGNILKFNLDDTLDIALKPVR